MLKLMEKKIISILHSKNVIISSIQLDFYEWKYG